VYSERIMALNCFKVRDHIPLKEGLRQTNVSVSAKFPDEIPDHIPLQEGLFQCTIFGVIWGRLAVAEIGMVIEAVKRDIGSDPVSRFAASFPLLRFLSVALPPFRRYEGSDPMLPASLRSVAHWVRPLPLPAASCCSLLLPVAPCRFLSLLGCHPGCAELLGATWGLTLLCHRVLLGWQQRV